jgi:hypothetical protein
MALAVRFHVGGKWVGIIVAYLLRAGTVEPEEQPLLANSSETTFVSRQRLQRNRFTRQHSMHNSGGTVFYGGPCQGIIRTTTEASI